MLDPSQPVVESDAISQNLKMAGRAWGGVGKAFDSTGEALVKAYDAVNKFPDLIQYGWDSALTLLPDDGGFTFTFGQGGGADAGLGVHGEAVDFLTIDFTNSKFVYGEYWSVQWGATAGIPSIDAGVSASYFGSEKFEAILSGMFNSTGCTFEVGAGATLSKVTTMPPAGNEVISGWQFGVGVGTPQAECHSHFGYGEITNFKDVKFRDIPSKIWEHLFW